jgi:flavin-dependent dehydrogenase
VTIFDAAVAGGGPAGAAAAMTLARRGARVALCDLRNVSTTGRTVVGESLVPSAKILLAELGVWDRFVADGHMPCYGNLSAWGSDEIAESDFIRSPFGHGWHLDRAKFDAMLRDAAVEAGAERVDALPDARWTIDATGRASAIARAHGVKRVHEDALLAFFATYRSATNTDEDSRTLVESAPDGWFHTALLPNRERVVTYFTDEKRPFDVTPTKHIRRILEEHRYEQSSEVRATDARTSRLEQLHGDGWIATGDAAISFDPLSSQGIVAALYSGVKAANAVLSGGLSEYESAIRTLWNAFLINRKSWYSVETRWRTPFWERRQ